MRFISILMKTFRLYLESIEFAKDALIKFAKHFPDFKEFSRFYSQDINHGYYWHLTDKADFKLSDELGPRDMSSMAGGRVKEPGAFMVTSHLEHWDDFYNDPEVSRPYVALLDLSEIDPKFLKQVGRGFGNEMYLNKENARKAKIVSVMPVERARVVDQELHMSIPQSERELYELWSKAHGH